VHSKADISQHYLPHGTENYNVEKNKTEKENKTVAEESAESVLMNVSISKKVSLLNRLGAI